MGPLDPPVRDGDATDLLPWPLNESAMLDNSEHKINHKIENN